MHGIELRKTVPVAVNRVHIEYCHIHGMQHLLVNAYIRRIPIHDSHLVFRTEIVALETPAACPSHRVIANMYRSMMTVGFWHLNTDIVLPSTSCVATIRSVKIFNDTFCLLLRMFHKSVIILWAFSTPVAISVWSSCSSTPSSITPPSVFVKAEYVSQMLLGRPPLFSSPQYDCSSRIWQGSLCL